MGLIDFLGVRSFFGFDTPPHRIKDPLAADSPGFNSPAWDYYSQQMKRPRDRVTRYRDVDRMDEYELIASALDLMAEDTCQLDIEHNSTMWVEAPNADVVQVGNDLFKRLNFEEILQSICRKMIKYGDNFETVVWDTDTRDIIHLQSPPSAAVSRVQQNGQLLGFNPGPSGEKPDKDGKVQWKPWEIIHFRMPSRDRDWLYGDSILYPAVSAWEQLKMAEDSMVVYRLLKAPDRTVYYIDVGQATPEEAYDIVNRWKTAIKKRTHLDTKSKDYRNQWHPNAADMDLFWPTREGSQSRIDRQPGSNNANDIVDIEYLRNKLFGTLRIPKGFMGFESEVSGGFNGESVLSAQSVRFAATIKSIRKALVSGVRRLVAVQLVYKRIDPRDPKNKFEIRMAPINYLDDLLRSKIFQLRIEMTRAASDLGMNIEGVDKKRWVTWALRRFLRFTDTDIEQLLGSLPPDIQGPDDVGGDADKLVQLVSSKPEAFNALLEAAVAGLSLKQEKDTPYPDNWDSQPLDWELLKKPAESNQDGQ